VLARLPRKPEAEFTRMKKAETAAAVLVRAQRMSKSSGVRKMPPPVESLPNRSPESCTLLLREISEPTSDFCYNLL